MSRDEDDSSTIRNCVIQLRESPARRRDKVYVGCGAGFGGDRPAAALKLLRRVKQLDYLVLECLAERTLADRFQIMSAGGDGYDSRVVEWMRVLLPLAVERGTCIVTNMGAIDPVGAQEKVLQVASSLGLSVSVAVAHEIPCRPVQSLGVSTEKSNVMKGVRRHCPFTFMNPIRVNWSALRPVIGDQDSIMHGSSTYLGAAPIVECLEKYRPNVVITSRVADAALFLAPMVYELGWNWDDLNRLAQGSLAGHLLECGCQLTGGYFMHPGDKFRDFPLASLLDLSLPYAEVSFDGNVCVAKVEGTGGVLNFSTCAEQLLYEVGDPCAYITPDVILDIRDVTFSPSSSSRVLCGGAKPSTLSAPDKLLCLVTKDCGWKGWGEISYGGYDCVQRAKAAEYLVRSWMEESCPGLRDNIVSYIVGLDSLKANTFDEKESSVAAGRDIRLRMDGLFDLKEQAIKFTTEFTALYTNGPAGGGGISTGHKKEILLDKELVEREQVFWRIGVKCTDKMRSHSFAPTHAVETSVVSETMLPPMSEDNPAATLATSPAPSGQKIPLFTVAHCRAGDKGNDLNFSIIPHFLPDIERLKLIITPEWVKKVVSPLLNTSSFPDPDTIAERNKWISEHVNVEIYEVRGISSMNVVVRNILDGGVNCSRRIDRHGKTISDVILCQEIVLPPC